MVAKEYSKALHELAEELKVVDLIKDEFEKVINLLKDNELMNFFTSPVIKANEKKDVIIKSLKNFNNDFIIYTLAPIVNDF